MNLPSTPAKPFEIAIPQADLDDMLTRLRHTRWAHEFGNDDFGLTALTRLAAGPGELLGLGVLLAPAGSPQ